MKLFYILAGTFLTVTGIPFSFRSNGFDRVDLPPPENWVAGPRLFPRNVIAGYNSDYGKYDSDSWADYVLDKCHEFDDCTSTLTFSGEKSRRTKVKEYVTDLYSAINSGSPKDRFWFGYVFRGGPTSQNDYQRDWNPITSVKDSVAFTTEDEESDIMRLQTQLK